MNTILFNLCCFCLTNIAITLIGYLIFKNRLVWPAWSILIVSISLVSIIFWHSDPVIKMLTIIATTFNGMKVVAATADSKRKLIGLSFMQWCKFAAGWAGMRAQPFEITNNKPLPGAWPMVSFGISRLAAGLGLIFLVRLIFKLPINADVKFAITSILLLIGLSLVLHFGLLSISAGMWRLSGINTYFLFKQPAKATSLTEFWSKRWNLAFSEMTSLTLFRPLKNEIGVSPALLIAFAFSGLLHELALSAPVNTGYGSPMLYFLLQGLLVMLEKSAVLQRSKLLKQQVAARVWTFFWLAVPAPLLFHTQFIKHVVWPLCSITPVF
ncbi:membrane bound O-acyl transferase family-domain-containing protein [Mucilaginibacter sp. PAMB04168]|uniref:wax synthase family protein n=1 Tax=Mucilaginibacter sp. PAMB04168 TaxID=3138567 RepID=UPI0031F6E785